MFSFRPMISRNVADWVRRSHGAALWLVARMVERPLAYPSLCIRQPDLIVAFISARNSVPWLFASLYLSSGVGLGTLQPSIPSLESG